MSEGASNKSFLFYFPRSSTDIGISAGVMKEGRVSNGGIALPKLSSPGLLWQRRANADTLRAPETGEPSGMSLKSCVLS